MKQIKNALAALFLGMLSLGASAQVSGNVGKTSVDGSNFYVYFSPPVAMCSGATYTWAFIRATDSNYLGYLNQIGQAKAFNYSVTITTSNVGGYCHIDGFGTD